MEPADLSQFVKDMRSAAEACRRQSVKIQSAEAAVKNRARRALYAACDIQAGEALREEDVLVVRPEGPLTPNDLLLLLGRTTKRMIHQYEPFALDMFG